LESSTQSGITRWREFLADEKKKISEQQNNMIFDAVEYQERSEAGESLLMRKGVIVRHLVMPDCVEDSKRVISYLLKTYGGQIFISIMCSEIFFFSSARNSALLPSLPAARSKTNSGSPTCRTISAIAALAQVK